MSASLVGSEMCIRDSFGEEAGVASPRGPKRAGPPRRDLRRPYPQGWAVSYTHLTLPTICSV
eukprot:8900073-Alexandrium_andersonii.AAC.1